MKAGVRFYVRQTAQRRCAARDFQFADWLVDGPGRPGRLPPCLFQGRLSLTFCDGQSVVDGIDCKRFQVHALLLAICKVNKSPLDVQWNGWVVWLPSIKEISDPGKDRLNDLDRTVGTLFVSQWIMNILNSLLKKD